MLQEIQVTYAKYPELCLFFQQGRFNAKKLPDHLPFASLRLAGRLSEASLASSLLSSHQAVALAFKICPLYSCSLHNIIISAFAQAECMNHSDAPWPACLA
jgi:hypothetical protein